MSPTLFDRPFWFLRLYRRITGAAFLVAADDHDRALNAVLEIGGPEALSWQEVAALYADLLGREVKITALPPRMFRAMGRAFAPLSPAAGNILGLNYAFAVGDTSMTGNELAAELGVAPLQTAKSFLEERCQHPRDFPSWRVGAHACARGRRSQAVALGERVASGTPACRRPSR